MLEIDELAMEDYRRDAYFDATHHKYKVTVPIVFEIPITAKTEDEAISDAYDEIKGALRGSGLDYEFSDDYCAEREEE